MIMTTLLLQAYKAHLINRGQDNETHAYGVDATVEFLTHTSKVIDLFQAKHVISSTTDVRLNHLSEFHAFLVRWKSSTGGKPERFLSSKLWFDLQSMIFGFQAIVTIKLKEYPQSVIKPAIINQDLVENHFCQIRACNGQNSNPTWRLQETAQNTVRYGQTTISRKSNAGLDGAKKQMY